MEITLEKIELVKDRTGVTYKEAKAALEAADGNVVDAIAAIEENCGLNVGGAGDSQATELVNKIKSLIKKGNVSKLVVRKGENEIVNLPLNVGLVGTLLAPVAAIAGLVAVFGTKCTFELVKTDGSVLDITGSAKEGFSTVVEKGGDLAGTAKEKGGALYKTVKEKAGDGIARISPEFDLDLDKDEDTGFGCGFCDGNCEECVGCCNANCGDCMECDHYCPENKAEKRAAEGFESEIPYPVGAEDLAARAMAEESRTCACGSGVCDGHCEVCEGCCNEECVDCTECERECTYKGEEK